MVKELKSIYNELSSDALLSKCLHGLTQNQNESFNGTIWERLPKYKYYSMTQLEFGVYVAVAYFNTGAKSCKLLYEKLNILPGYHTLKGCTVRNRKRLYVAEYKYNESTKKRRRLIRGLKKGKDDKYIEHEGTVYDAGAF